MGVDEVAVGVVRLYLKHLRQVGIEVPFAVLFRSRAQGSHGPASDIDVVVVSARFDEARDRRDADLLWRVAALTDSRIEPIP